MKKITPDTESIISPHRRSQRLIRSSTSPKYTDVIKENRVKHTAKLVKEAFPLKILNKENKDEYASISDGNIYEKVKKVSEPSNNRYNNKENLNSFERENNKKKKGSNEICNVSGASSNCSPEAQTNNKGRSVLYTTHNGSKDASYSFLSTQAKMQLSSWGLPDAVLKNYEEKGVTTMFPWQAECLALPGVLSGKNLVYSAPTSAGKTLVAELLLLKRVLETGKKGIFILPFVSVAREKMYYLQKMFGSCGVRVEGFMGSQGPPGGLKVTDIAVCTIEKANNLINRLLEAGKLDKLGMIVVDELHMLGDSHRGYLLELMLTKVLFMATAQKQQEESAENRIQIVGMSATLPNLDLLSEWLKAQLYHTDFRPVPLSMNIKLKNAIYDSDMNKIRELNPEHTVKGDSDHLIQLCLETVLEGFAVLVFCPSKAWCEKLAESVARAFFSIGKPDSQYPANVSAKLREYLNPSAISRVLDALQKCPVGLDKVLKKSVSFGAAYHHAGLTFEERDIIEGGFRANSIKVLIATSTLSSGVNLPARRVIIRSPMFGGSILDTLTYRQMAGRAGRKGVDTQGESILVCRDQEAHNGKLLIKSTLPPITSCLKHDASLTSSMKRAMLEVIVSGVACSPAEVERYFGCTLLSASLKNQESSSSQQEKQDAITICVDFLLENEFIRLQEVSEHMVYVGTQLGMGVLASGLSPDEGLHVFSELHRARQCFVLENELHLIYQVTPIYMSWPNLEWLNFLSVWEDLTPDMKRVGELVGVEESFIVRAMKGTINFKVRRQARKMAVHQRFYTSLALHELVQEIPLNSVAEKYSANKGMLQSLQMSAASFAGMVTVFCNRLGWHNLETLIAQFHDRLHFGIQRELCDLVRLSHLNGQRARELYNAGLEKVMDVAQSTPHMVENIFRSAMPFHSTKISEGDPAVGTVWLTGDKPATPAQAANLIVDEARTLIKKELGLVSIDWSQRAKSVTAKDREELSPKRSAQNSSHLLSQDTLNHSTKNNSFISRQSFGSDRLPLQKRRKSKSPYALLKNRSTRELSKRKSFSPKNLIEMSKRRSLRNKIVEESEVLIQKSVIHNSESLTAVEIAKQTKSISPKGTETKSPVICEIQGDINSNMDDDIHSKACDSSMINGVRNNDTNIKQTTSESKENVLPNKENGMKLKIDSLEINTKLEKSNKGTTSEIKKALEDLNIEMKCKKRMFDLKKSEEMVPSTSKDKNQKVKQNQSKNIVVDFSKLVNRNLIGNINKFGKFNESIDSVFLSLESPKCHIGTEINMKQKESKDLNGRPKNILFKEKFVPNENKLISINEEKKDAQANLLGKKSIDDKSKQVRNINSDNLNQENYTERVAKKPKIDNETKQVRTKDSDHLNQENEIENVAKKPKKTALSKVLFGKPRQKSNESENVVFKNKTQKNTVVDESKISKVLFGKLRQKDNVLAPRQKDIVLDETKTTESNDFFIPESQENKEDNVFSPKHKEPKRLHNKMKIVNSASLVKKLNDTKRNLENQTSTPLRDFGAQNKNGKLILKSLCENGASEIKSKVSSKEIRSKITENSKEVSTSSKSTDKQGNIARSDKQINSDSHKTDFEDTLDDIVANLSFNESQGFEVNINVSGIELMSKLGNNHGRDSDMFDNSTEKNVNEFQDQIYLEQDQRESNKIISDHASKKVDLELFDDLNHEDDSNKNKSNQHTNTKAFRRYGHDWNTLDSQDFIDMSMENNLKEYDALEKTNVINVDAKKVHSSSKLVSDGSFESSNVIENKRYAEFVNTEAINDIELVNTEAINDAELVNTEDLDDSPKMDRNEFGVLWDTMDTADFADMSVGSAKQSDTCVSDPDLTVSKRAKQLREKVMQEFSDTSEECLNLEDIENALENDTDISEGSDMIEFVGDISIESRNTRKPTSLQKKLKEKNNARKRSINSKIRRVGLSRHRSSGKSSKRKMSSLVNKSFKRPKLECTSIRDEITCASDSIILDRGMETPLYDACSEELDFGVDLTKSEGNLKSELKKTKGAESLNNGTYICTRKDSEVFVATRNGENKMLSLSDFDSDGLEGNDIPANLGQHSRVSVHQEQCRNGEIQDNDNIYQKNLSENVNESISDSFLEEAFESYFEIPSEANISNVQIVNVPVNHTNAIKVNKQKRLSIADNTNATNKVFNDPLRENITTHIGEPTSNFTFGNTFACVSQWNVTEALSEENNQKAQLNQDDEKLLQGNKINSGMKTISVSHKNAAEKNIGSPKPGGSKLNKLHVSKERLSHDLFASTPSPEPRKLEEAKLTKSIMVKDKSRALKETEEVNSKMNLVDTYSVTDKCNDSNIADRNIEANESCLDMSASFQCSSDTLYIIDVVGDSKLFKTFIEEWSQQKVFSMGLACEKKQPQPKQGGGIGFRIGNGVRSSRRAPKTKEVEVAGVIVENTELLIVGISICWGHEVYYINLRTTQQGPISCSLPTPPISDQVPFEERVEKVKQTLEKLCIIGNCSVRMWDVKTSVSLLAASNIGYFACQLEDPKVAAWMLDPSDKEKSIQDLVMTYAPEHQHLLGGVGVSWGHGPLGVNPKNPGSPRVRASTESLITHNIMVSLKNQLKQVGMISSFQEVEMDNVLVLAYMELTGMGFSLAECEAQREIMQSQLSKLEKEAYSLVGHTFSLTSPDEVSKVLYQSLRLPNLVTGRGRGTRTAGPTNKEALEKLKKLHPLPGVVLEWRRINSSLTKVVFPLQQARIHCSRLAMDRIHSVVNTFTATGRVTMHDPNLQMMPRDFNIQIAVDQQHNLNSSRLRQQRNLVDSGIMEQLAPLLTGGETEQHTVSLRHALVPGNGHVMLAVDYSQLELRILAHLSSDVRLLGLLNSGSDVFKSIAAQIHSVDMDQVSDEQRQAAKQVCYGMIYGMGARALAEQLSIEEEEAYVFMDKFMRKFPGVQKFLSSTVEICKKQGFVTTILGRRRYLPNISSQNSHSKAQSERQAVNTSIQGSAADLVKLAMVQINTQLHEAFPNSPYFITQPLQRKQQLSGAWLVLQLHDELIYEVVAEDLVQVAQLVQYKMENVKQLAVELPVKMKVGPSWGTMQTLTL